MRATCLGRWDRKREEREREREIERERERESERERECNQSSKQLPFSVVTSVITDEVW